MFPTLRLNVERMAKMKLYIAFWIFGICNNFPYVVMLSAAHDILKKLDNQTVSNVHYTNLDSVDDFKIDLHCTKLGTGAILLADILPTLLFKLVAPFFIQKIRFPHKILFVVTAAISSFIIVGFSNSIPLTLFGVVMASLSSGVGEVSFLSLTAFYDQNSVSLWSSGTGGAGVFGALSYASLALALGPENTLFCLSFFPLFILVGYFFLLKKTNDESFNWTYSSYQSFQDDELHSQDSSVLFEDNTHLSQKEPLPFEKFKLMKSFLYLTLPLCFVYLFEYIINQAMFELLFFPNSSIIHSDQYRWYQVTYQVGVFISRSSINVIKVEKTWIFPILQGINVALFICQIVYRFIPQIWIVFLLILYEGFLGGGAYVNTFYMILTRSQTDFKEYNMAAASLWDSFGIAGAGFIAVPLHNLLCDKFSTSG